MATAVVAGCGGPPPVRSLPPPPPPLVADLPTLVARANAWAVPAIQARGTLRLRWARSQDDRHVEVRLLATRAGALRLQGSRTLLPALFDLAADGLRMWLRVPSRETFYTGAAAAPAAPDPERPYLALRPHHLTEALLPQPLPPPPVAGEDALVLEEYPDHYVVTWLRTQGEEGLQPRRKVWVERRNLQVTRIQGFEAAGRLGFDARYSGYPSADPDAYPRRVVVERPWEQLVVELELEEVRKDPPLPSDAFTLVPAPGDRVVPIEEAIRETAGAFPSGGVRG